MSKMKESGQVAWGVIGSVGLGVVMYRMGYTNWAIGIITLGMVYFIMEVVEQWENMQIKFKQKMKNK